jgi:hypothetical protein
MSLEIPCAITILEDLEKTFTHRLNKVVVVECIEELQKHGFIKISSEELAIEPLPKTKSKQLEMDITFKNGSQIKL